MAIYHHSVSVIGRSKGKSAVAAAAYRSGEKIEDIRTGIIHDYTKKTGVDYSEIITPELSAIDTSWLIDRAKLWNRVEAAEKRYDAQLCREVTLAIPIELSRDNQIQLVRDYVQATYVAEGMVADVNLHNLDSKNPHAHVLLTMRSLIVTDDGHVEFGNKNRKWNTDAKWWDAKDLLIEQRQNWETVANQYLADNGYDRIRIDCRSLEAQGVDRIPQVHLGATAASMRSKGKSTRIGDEYDRIEAANNDIRQQLEEIYNDKLAIVDLDRQCESLEAEISDLKAEIIQDDKILARYQRVNRIPSIVKSDRLLDLIGEERVKWVVQWLVKNIVIPDGQTEIQIKSQTHAVTITAIDVDQQTIAYVFADQKTEDQLKITCSKSSGSMLSMAGSMTESTGGSIFQKLLTLHVSAYKEMLSSRTKIELEVKPPDPVTIPETEKIETVAPQVEISVLEIDQVEALIPQEQVSVLEVNKAETLTSTEQISVPEINKSETLTSTEQASIPETEKIKTAVKTKKKVISRGR
jgi:hypothetical protein